MTFCPIHPSIVDLYVNALTLHLLEEALGKVGPDGLTKDLQEQIDLATSKYVISAQKAEALFGDSSKVQLQLNAFSSQRYGVS